MCQNLFVTFHLAICHFHIRLAKDSRPLKGYQIIRKSLHVDFIAKTNHKSVINGNIEIKVDLTREA
jgi:hypothetical protein